MCRLQPFSYLEVARGEYRVAFKSRDRTRVKRKALDYWYRNRAELRLTMHDFFRRCRLSPDGREITFSSESTPRR